MNIYFPETYDSIVNSRIAELFNLASSASFGSRVGSFANGWEVIKRIENSKTTTKTGISEALPVEPIIIFRARRL